MPLKVSCTVCAAGLQRAELEERLRAAGLLGLLEHVWAGLEVLRNQAAATGALQSAAGAAEVGADAPLHAKVAAGNLSRQQVSEGLTDAEWCMRWGLTRGPAEENKSHLTLVYDPDVGAFSSPKPDAVLQYTGPTPGYCCALTDNVYGIEFESYEIRDTEQGTVIFQVAGSPPIDYSQIPPEYEDQVRCASFDFGVAFLDIPGITTQLTFSVGDNELPNFRQIERHYFRDTLLSSFDFEMAPRGCVPNSTKTVENHYERPVLDPEMKQQLIENPYETQSDTFYYVGDVMVMHRKTEYAYSQSTLQTKVTYGRHT